MLLAAAGGAKFALTDGRKLIVELSGAGIEMINI